MYREGMSTLGSWDQPITCTYTSLDPMWVDILSLYFNIPPKTPKWTSPPYTAQGPHMDWTSPPYTFPDLYMDIPSL